MTKAKRITKGEAVKEARIGAKLKGGTWYVVRRGDYYKAVPADSYNRRQGRVAEIIDLDAERAASMVTSEKSPAKQEIVADHPVAIDITPSALRTSAGIERVTRAQKEWDDATHALANFVREVFTEAQVFTEGKVDDEMTRRIKLFIAERDRKQETFLRSIAGIKERCEDCPHDAHAGNDCPLCKVGEYCHPHPKGWVAKGWRKL